MHIHKTVHTSMRTHTYADTHRSTESGLNALVEEREERERERMGGERERVAREGKKRGLKARARGGGVIQAHIMHTHAGGRFCGRWYNVRV